jgi:hypothetical protein
VAAGAAAIALVAAGGGGPVAADYAPFVTIQPTEGPPGTTIEVMPDASGRCGNVTYTDQGPVVDDPGTVVVELGTLAKLPDIGGIVVLDEVLDTVTVDAGADGLWSATLTVPADAPPGKLYVTGHCDVPETTTTEAPDTPTRSSARTLLYDYYPATFTVLGETTTSTTPPTPTTTVPAPPAPAVEGTSSFTG